MTRRRILLTLAGVLVLVVAAGAAGVHLLTRGRLDHGTVFTADSGPLTVKPGQLFSIEVTAHPTWGDSWQVAPPGADAAAVRATGAEFVKNLGVVSGDGVFGSGGHYYFVFRAQDAGRATITLHNRSADRPMAPPAGTPPEHPDRTYTVEVRA
ncbi:protease inhibitor I42 family protein [Kitasatospora sp. NBC_01560]|uniref:protease inhibitor I42 family protein n=1 Tax=Kitasatospora sp. NBC_01560 TaxID=2975965 RepID=UPI0038641916